MLALIGMQGIHTEERPYRCWISMKCLAKSSIISSLLGHIKIYIHRRETLQVLDIDEVFGQK